MQTSACIYKKKNVLTLLNLLLLISILTPSSNKLIRMEIKVNRSLQGTMTDNTSTANVLTREELKETSENVKELKENTQYTVVTWQNIHNVHGGWLPTYDKKTTKHQKHGRPSETVSRQANGTCRFQSNPPTFTPPESLQWYSSVVSSMTSITGHTTVVWSRAMRSSKGSSHPRMQQTVTSPMLWNYRVETT